MVKRQSLKELRLACGQEGRPLSDPRAGPPGHAGPRGWLRAPGSRSGSGYDMTEVRRARPTSSDAKLGGLGIRPNAACVGEPVSRSKSRKLLTMRAGTLVPALFLVAVPAGCGRYEAVSPTAPEDGTAAVTPPVAAGRAYVTQEGLSIVMLDVPGKTMGLPPEPRPYDLSAAALAEALERAGGRASIGIKAPESPRVMESGGYRAPVLGAVVYQALESLEAVGAQIYRYLHNSGIAHVIVDPSLADVLMTHPFVDFIQPRLPELTATVE